MDYIFILLFAGYLRVVSTESSLSRGSLGIAIALRL